MSGTSITITRTVESGETTARRTSDVRASNEARTGEADAGDGDQTNAMSRIGERRAQPRRSATRP
jgi:hypothetical protein